MLFSSLISTSLQVLRNLRSSHTFISPPCQKECGKQRESLCLVISSSNLFDRAENFRRMKTTFVCNESMVISIPIGKLKDAGPADLMPEKFTCVFKDSYKIFVLNGKPKPLGAAQAIAGVFLFCLGVIMNDATLIYTLPSVLFVVSGLLSYAAGRGPHMGVAKLSFSLNIISFFWSLAAFTLSVLVLVFQHRMMIIGVNGLMISLLAVECFLALFLIYWLSKAVCRQHFNTLPIILLKHGD